MKARCPKDENHKEFITVAHISQDWLVDENGNWLETVTACLETVAKPDIGNTWVCKTCGAEAIVENYEEFLSKG